MNSYDLSSAWFQFAFDNPEKVKPGHHALYFWCIEVCNSLGWKDKFGLPTQHTMDVLGIKNYKTYSNHLHDLVDFGFITLVQLSKNQFTSNIIAMVKNTKALPKAYTKALSRQVPKQVQSIVSIDKPINYINNKLLNNNISSNEDFDIDENLKIEFGNFHKLYPGTKRGLEIEFENLKKKHKNFKEIIPILKKELNRQFSEKQQQADASNFVAAWKNMSTYINNQAWTESFQVQKISKQNDNHPPAPIIKKFVALD